jgi:DNA-directed RNA polymerase specialized sigma24 family protein
MTHEAGNSVGVREQRTFTAFVEDTRQRLTQALVASFGTDVGHEALSEAYAHAWESWDRVSAMDNPAGYVYTVGRNRGRRAARRRPAVYPPVATAYLPWVEPALPSALASLSNRQRLVVMLVYCHEWSLQEVADYIGVSKATVQRHGERGLSRLRTRLGVES